MIGSSLKHISLASFVFVAATGSPLAGAKESVGATGFTAAQLPSSGRFR